MGKRVGATAGMDAIENRITSIFLPGERVDWRPRHDFVMVMGNYGVVAEGRSNKRVCGSSKTEECTRYQALTARLYCTGSTFCAYDCFTVCNLSENQYKVATFGTM